MIFGKYIPILSKKTTQNTVSYRSHIKCYTPCCLFIKFRETSTDCQAQIYESSTSSGPRNEITIENLLTEVKYENYILHSCFAYKIQFSIILLVLNHFLDSRFCCGLR